MNGNRALFATLAGLAVVIWLGQGVGLFNAEDSGGVEGGDTESDGGVGILAQLRNVLANTVTPAPTTLSPDGLAMLKGIESFSASAYPDAAGHSIGYGHFIQAGEDYLLSAVIDEAQASDLLANDVGWAERAVSAAVSVPLTQQQFDALVIFCYNIGETAFKKSTLVRLLNAGDYAGAAAQFALWNKSNGQVLDALVQRRAEEAELFTSGVYA